MDIITCKNITVHNEKTLALDDVSFSVKKGEFLTVVGENGAGKSTLIRVVLGISAPDKGTVTVDGSANGKIGYLPQQSEAGRDFPASVYEVVMSGNIGRTGFFSFYKKAMRERTMENMRLLGIEGLAKESFRALSGGQQQRVLLARALCAADEVLLLDEPTTGLDPIVTKELYATVKHLQKEHGMTVIMVSHDIAAALKYSDRILHLATSVKFIGSVEEYKKTPYGASFEGDGYDR